MVVKWVVLHTMWYVAPLSSIQWREDVLTKLCVCVDKEINVPNMLK